jgi:hypothetical protein
VRSGAERQHLERYVRGCRCFGQLRELLVEELELPALRHDDDEHGRGLQVVEALSTQWVYVT